MNHSVPGFRTPPVSAISVDFHDLNKKLSPEKLVPQWLPKGRREGSEWVALNPTRPDRSLGSFKVDLNSGKWSDFATGDAGGDLISLWAYLHHGNDQKAAALDLLQHYVLSKTPQTPRTTTASRISNTRELKLLMPVPEGAPHPDLTHSRYGTPSASWPYYDATGNLLFYVARFDLPKTNESHKPGKVILPLSYHTDGKNSWWQWKGITGETPRPLYGLDRLASRPNALVIVCEGEKAADAAQKLFPESVAISWLGGANSANKADWTPLQGRNVVVWPDNDEVGYDAASCILDHVSPITSSLAIIEPSALNLSDDAADVGIEVAQQLLNNARQIQSRAPTPLPDSLPPVPSFDPELLPEDIRSYVMDVAHRQQCPPDFCAVAALVCLAGLIGNKVAVRPKQYDDWTITPVLWGAMIGGPSAMKSPALKAMRGPLDDLELELQRDHEHQLVEHETSIQLAKLKKDAIRDKAKKLLKQGDSAAAQAALSEAKQEAAEPPPLPRLIVNDATVEALGERLNENPNGLTLIRDEIAGLLTQLSKEEYASARAFLLECFNGDSRFTYDRIGRGTLSIQRCTLSVIGGIQPSRLAPLVRSAAKGITDDGLIQRFQLGVYPDLSKDWDWNDQTPNAEAITSYREIFLRLHSIPPSPDEIPRILRFSAQAQQLFIEWMHEIQQKARSGTLPPIMESYLLKMPKTVCSLALIFALIEGETHSIDAKSTARALEWADYLILHAERIYSTAAQADVRAAKLILARRNKLSNPFTARDLQRKEWTGIDRKTAGDALELLVEHNYLLTTQVHTGGRTKTLYQWHESLEVA